MMKNIVKKLFDPFMRRLDDIHLLGQLNSALSLASASFQARQIDLRYPHTWEASGFSQNGEDGIIDVLLSNCIKKNRFFLEVGSGSGMENNTSFLAHVKKYSGIQIEGNSNEHFLALKNKAWLVDCRNIFLTIDRIPDLLKSLPFQNPDLFSIDIDGMDYYMVESMLNQGFRPKVAVVEYNSAFGPSNCVTVPYADSFDMFSTPFSYLYYGASIAAWKLLYTRYGYSFITVEGNGVNAFFVDSKEFLTTFISSLEGSEFRENMHQLRRFNMNWEGQFQQISHLDFFEVRYENA